MRHLSKKEGGYNWKSARNVVETKLSDDACDITAQGLGKLMLVSAL